MVKHTHNPAMPPEWYEFRVEGALPGDWSNWFDGLAIQAGPAGESVLSGPMADQAALHGVLAKIRDLNLTLISVRWIPPQAGLGSQLA
jgi:hypothetical protein